MRNSVRSIIQSVVDPELGVSFYIKKLIFYIITGLLVSLGIHILVERQFAAGTVDYLQRSFRQSSAMETSQDLYGFYCATSRHRKCSIRLISESGEIINQIPTIQTKEQNIRVITFHFNLIQYEPPLIAEINYSPSLSSSILWTLLGCTIGIFFFLIYFAGHASTRRNDLKHKVEKMELLLRAESTQAELGTLAAQVSHDIRSPLTALNMVLAQLSNIPESHRLLIKSAIGRINDIANSMLAKSKALKLNPIQSKSVVPTAHPFSELHVELIPALVDELVSEKRIQFESLNSIILNENLSDAYGAFAKVNQSELKRALSNLINNAIEACEGKPGTVTVEVTLKQENSTPNTVDITIMDNGKGMTNDIIEKIGNRGVTYGKTGTNSGTGLGLYHAKHTIKSFNGDFIVNSVLCNGTKITIRLPLAKPPIWFLKAINVSDGTTIAVLDDDSSIYAAWREKFSNNIRDGAKLNFLNFNSCDTFKDWYRKKSQTASFLYLIDFDLGEKSQSGLELITYFGIQDQSILVTSRYQENEIRDQCQNEGVKILPKNMMGIVPINIIQPK